MSDFVMLPARLATRPALLLFTVVLAAALLTGCGGGGAGEPGAVLQGAPSAGPLTITTTTLPAASNGVAYAPTPLEAHGAAGPVSWRVAEGTLPPGMDLTTDGRIVGTPLESGFFAFTAEADDARAHDHRALAISVDTFGLHVTEGLRFGDAWSGVPVTLRCAGFAAGASFDVVRSDSGGSLHHVDTAAGTAVWLPGRESAPGSQDVIRARCAQTDSEAEITLDVAPDVTEGHIARFGSTDVWYLDFDAKRGAHPYASDWHAALARLGLRASTDVAGTEAERLADLAARVATLRHLNRMFLREENGTAGAEGLAISFPLERPGAGYGTPMPGGIVGGQADLYSVMSICDQTGALSAYGVAIADEIGNPRVENNSPGGMGALGTFVNYVAESVQNTYREHRGVLTDAPVGAADVPALKALLYGRDHPGGRYEALAYFIDALGENVAYIAAHETGHSLGLRHTSTYTSGSIMNTVGVIGPGGRHFFLAEDLAKLRLGLPGAGRAIGQQKTGAGSAAVAAIHVCDGACH